MPDGYQRGRIDWLDAARGIAISLVVLLHASSWLDTAGLPSQLWDDVNHVLGPLRMPLFFTVSGLLAKSWVTRRSWRDLLSKKVLWLMWAYLLWQPIGSAAAVVAAQFTGDVLTPFRMAASLALTPIRPRFDLWFLWALSVYFVVAHLSRRVPPVVQIAGAGLIALVGYSSLVPEGQEGWNGVPKYYLFFLVGCYGGQQLLRFAERVNWPIAILILGAFLPASIAVYVTGTDQVWGVGLALRLFGMVAGIALATRLAGVSLLRFLGSRTLPLYLAHSPIVVVLAWVAHLAFEGRDVPYVGGVLPPLAAVLAATIALGLYALLRGTPGMALYEPPPWVRRIAERMLAQRPPARHVGSSRGRGDVEPSHPAGPPADAYPQQQYPEPQYAPQQYAQPVYDHYAQPAYEQYAEPGYQPPQQYQPPAYDQYQRPYYDPVGTPPAGTTAVPPAG